MIGGNKLISPDLPITKSTEDKLNRGEFAKSLAKTISQYSFPSSFTIGLYGEWGSGKTSLVNMMLEAVEDIDNNAIILQNYRAIKIYYVERIIATHTNDKKQMKKR